MVVLSGGGSGWLWCPSCSSYFFGVPGISYCNEHRSPDQEGRSPCQDRHSAAYAPSAETRSSWASSSVMRPFSMISGGNTKIKSTVYNYDSNYLNGKGEMCVK